MTDEHNKSKKEPNKKLRNGSVLMSIILVIFIFILFYKHIYYMPFMFILLIISFLSFILYLWVRGLNNRAKKLNNLSDIIIGVSTLISVLNMAQAHIKDYYFGNDIIEWILKKSPLSFSIIIVFSAVAVIFKIAYYVRDYLTKKKDK